MTSATTMAGHSVSIDKAAVRVFDSTSDEEHHGSVMKIADGEAAKVTELRRECQQLRKDLQVNFSVIFTRFSSQANAPRFQVRNGVMPLGFLQDSVPLVELLNTPCE